MRGIIFSDELQENLKTTCQFGAIVDVEEKTDGYYVVLRIPYAFKEFAESAADELLGKEQGELIDQEEKQDEQKCN